MTLSTKNPFGSNRISLFSSPMGGYMGLTRPYDTLWADGRKVTVYPNGKVVETANGQYVRKPDYDYDYNEPTKTMADAPDMKTAAVLVGIAVVGGLIVYGVKKVWEKRGDKFA